MKISRTIGGLRAKSLEECRKSHQNAKRLRKSRGLLTEAFIPSDEPDAGDVAFGVTRKGRYLDATMVQADDYAVRGIVKKRLHDDVIFWENVDELLRRREFVKIADNLLKQGLIDDAAKVYGAGDGDHLALAFDVAQGW